ncbi:MAG: hypothetical protein ACOH1T_03885 [Microbacteriaceae bacterium]
MQLTFEVGVDERHTVVFTFDKFWGNLNIFVDGTSVVSTVQVLNLSLVSTWKFEVGHAEKHSVQIDKHRKIALAGYRPQPVYAYVDGALVAQAVA